MVESIPLSHSHFHLPSSSYSLFQAFPSNNKNNHGNIKSNNSNNNNRMKEVTCCRLCAVPCKPTMTIEKKNRRFNFCSFRCYSKWSQMPFTNDLPSSPSSSSLSLSSSPSSSSLHTTVVGKPNKHHV